VCDEKAGRCKCDPQYAGEQCQVSDPLAGLEQVVKNLPAAPRQDHETLKMEIMWGVLGIDRQKSSSIAPLGDGIKQGNPVWDETFDITDPIAQISILTTCQFAKQGLLQDGFAEDCFMEDIANYARQSGIGFPVPKDRFLSLAMQVSPPKALRLGYAQDGRKILWARIYIKSKIPPNLASFELYEHFRHFETFVETRNRLSPSTCNKAWQTTNKWLPMMTEVAAVHGIVRSVAIAVTFALACVMLFIHSFRVAVFCTLIVASIVTCTFGILAAAGWSLGTVEAICITMLVGLSVDYAVHICDSFVNNGLSEEGHLMASRADRITAALGHVGTPVLHSACTTILASLVLCFCQIQLLVKVGIVIAVNASIGIVMTIVFLPALLALVGPENLEGSMTMSAQVGRILAAIGIVGLVLIILEVAMPGND